MSLLLQTFSTVSKELDICDISTDRLFKILDFSFGHMVSSMKFRKTNFSNMLLSLENGDFYVISLRRVNISSNLLAKLKKTPPDRERTIVIMSEGFLYCAVIYLWWSNTETRFCQWALNHTRALLPTVDWEIIREEKNYIGCYFVKLASRGRYGEYEASLNYLRNILKIPIVSKRHIMHILIFDDTEVTGGALFYGFIEKINTYIRKSKFHELVLITLTSNYPRHLMPDIILIYFKDKVTLRSHRLLTIPERISVEYMWSERELFVLYRFFGSNVHNFTLIYLELPPKTMLESVYEIRFMPAILIVLVITLTVVIILLLLKYTT